MDLSRRSVVVGLGLLATGSGATFTSAAFNDSTNSNGDIRVVTGDGLVVEAGDAFNSDGTVNQTDPSPTYNYTDRFTENKSFFSGPDNLDKISISDLPVATVNKRETVANRNNGLSIQVAVPLEKTTYEFKNILRIRNTGVTKQEGIGIAYKSLNPDGSVRFDGYGPDVGSKSDQLTETEVQQIFQFNTSASASNINGTPRISPAPLGGSSPDNEISISSGNTVNITLKVDLRDNALFDPEDKVLDATSLAGNPFTGKLDTVQLLKKIRVGKDY